MPRMTTAQENAKASAVMLATGKGHRMPEVFMHENGVWCANCEKCGRLLLVGPAGITFGSALKRDCDKG